MAPRLPQVLFSGSPDLLLNLESQYPNRFQFIQPWESPLPQPQFLSSYAQSIQALVLGAIGSMKLNSATLDCLPSLKLVITPSAGVNHLDVPELRRRGVAIANAGDIFSKDVADVAVGLLIDVLKKVSMGDRFVRQGLWSTTSNFPLGSKVSGKRIGIVGLGRIGSEVAKRLEAFSCKISYNSRTKKPNVSYSFYSNVQDLAANSDALIICCGLTEDTHHLINREVMVALGKDGVLINVGRGPIVNEKELVESLIKGDIGGAGLDVFENEPNVPEQLRALDNVVLSPHCAFLTSESRVAILKTVVDNLEAFFSNKPLVTPYVDE